MKSAFLLILAILILSAPSLRAASYGDFKKGMAAAQEAFKKREMQKARDILEGISENADAQGPMSKTEHAFAHSAVLHALGAYEEAHIVLDSALEKIGPRPVAPKMQLARGLLQAIKADVFYMQRQYNECLPLAREAAQTLERVAGKFHPRLFFLNWIIGDAYEALKKPAEAEAAYKSALKLAQSRQTYTVVSEFAIDLYTSDNSAFGVVQVNVALGDLYRGQKRLKEAEDSYKAGLKSAESDFGKKTAMVAMPLRGLALTYHEMNRGKEFEAAIARIETLAAKTERIPLAALDPLWLRVSDHLRAQETAAAEKAVAQMLEIHLAQKYEPVHFASRAPKSAEMHGMARKAIEARFGAQSGEAAGRILELGGAAERAREPALARRNYEAVAASQQNAADKIFLTSALTRLAELSVGEGDHAGALKHRQQVTQLLRAKYGEDSRVADSLEAEAALLKKTGKEEEAATIQAQAQEVRTKAFLKR